MPAYVFNAKPGDICETVIMPGDPLRAKYIAENYLNDARQITDVRNMLGFSGTYNDTKLTVVGHGMGIPSASLYCTELVKEYGVKRLIRVGSCGTVSDKVKLRDLVIAMGASTDSNVNRIRFGGYDFAAMADYNLLEKVVDSARTLQVKHHVANVFTSDYFYPPQNTEMWETLERYNVPVVEMEIAGIYGVAAEYGAQAVAMCTVSDEVLTGNGLTVEERQNSFDEMIKVALNTVASLD
jgi:purine-nucleoside phosphorylase